MIEMSEQPLTLKSTYEGDELVHRRLWRIVEMNAKAAEEQVEGSFYPALISQVFAFHTIEAYLNFVGERIAPEIWKDERNYFRREPYRGWDGKLRKVMELVDLTREPDKRPQTTIARLRFLRDLIAHGKSERFAGEHIHSSEERPPLFPPSTLTAAVAPREELPDILSDVEEFLNDIHRRAAPKIEVLWANTDSAIWFGSEALRGPSRYSSGTTTLMANH